MIESEIQEIKKSHEPFGRAKFVALTSATLAAFAGTCWFLHLIMTRNLDEWISQEWVKAAVTFSAGPAFIFYFVILLFNAWLLRVQSAVLVLKPKWQRDVVNALALFQVGLFFGWKVFPGDVFFTDMGNTVFEGMTNPLHWLLLGLAFTPYLILGFSTPTRIEFKRVNLEHQR